MVTLDGRDFDALASSVRESIEKNEPEAGLDRLHAFIVKFVRVLCEKHSIVVDRQKVLHSIFGDYIKKLRADGFIESVMTERILKTSISNLEAFNDVRNEQSLAHPNAMLNYSESLLILNNIASLVKFLSALEERIDEQANVVDEANIPF